MLAVGGPPSEADWPLAATRASLSPLPVLAQLSRPLSESGEHGRNEHAALVLRRKRQPSGAGGDRADRQPHHERRAAALGARLAPRPHRLDGGGARTGNRVAASATPAVRKARRAGSVRDASRRRSGGGGGGRQGAIRRPAEEARDRGQPAAVRPGGRGPAQGGRVRGGDPRLPRWPRASRLSVAAADPRPRAPGEWRSRGRARRARDGDAGRTGQHPRAKAPLGMPGGHG